TFTRSRAAMAGCAPLANTSPTAKGNSTGPSSHSPSHAPSTAAASMASVLSFFCFSMYAPVPRPAGSYRQIFRECLLHSSEKYCILYLTRKHLIFHQRHIRKWRECFLEKTPKFYIVEAAALPEIFLKVAEAKRMLETGETDKVNEATKAVGISRSAFYKYRDSIAPFQNLMAGRIITFQLMLKNKSGVLSSLLSIFASCRANILTINQAIPTGGRAMVTVSAETGELKCSLEELLRRIEGTAGVVKAEMVAG